MQNTQRRCTMWSHEAIKQINAISRSNRYNDSGCWHEGWWQFAQLPPRLSKRQHQRRSLPDQRVVAKKKGDDGANGLSRSKDSPISTPIARRKRDQSDIKWNAVLGSLLQPHSSTQFKGDNYNSIEKLQTESKTAEEKELVFLSQVSMELLVMCQGESAIDPKRDMIMCIVVCHLEDWQRNEQSWGSVGSNGCRNYRTVVWSCSPVVKLWRLGLPSHVEHRCCENELDMIMDMSKCICQTDPDILCGYDLQGGSWGYLIERTELVYGIHICNALSRISNTGIYRQQQQTGPEHKNESCNHYKGIEIDIVGRHTLNVWKIMRSELNITSYTFENVVAKVLGERSPHYSPATLSSWVSEGPVVAQARALRHVLYRAAAVLRILEKARIVDRAAEFASVIGIDFQSVLTRGSQFRVESLMARIAHPELYILSSPTRGQVAQQHAAECLPLVLEPQSRYYTDPVVVLDFQSLYPSMMIAYNYCFSTCLGRLEEAASVPASVSILSGDSGSSRRLGFTSFDMPSGLLAALGHSNITVSPNGVMFVKPSVRKGLLGRMLQEILESRVMIKEAISLWGKDDKPLYKKLDAWQLGLKLIANVTYGYTGASFSGRMPCVDVADAIVQAGRETLENAIKFVHTRHSTWGAEVVYGDTDSMFLHFPGKSRESAIRIGHEIAEAVTNLNPAPVKLNFEKVYQPCVLLTKKRYVGWMYSSVDQAEPQLDVKGMELVRRDGCGVQQRILEGAIDIMFRKNDLSLVKSFVTQQITKVLRGEVPLEEFIIAKEVRMGTYSGRTLPAHVKVAVDNMAYDMQAEPQYGERVPYVVVSNGICSRLNDQVVRPHMLLKRADLRLNAQYYIEKQITPALDRVFSLMGVDVRAWIDKMPKRLRSSIYNVLTDGDSESENDPIIEPPDIHQMLRPQPLYIQAAPPDQLISGRTEARGSRKHMSRTLDHFYLKRSCILCTKAVAAVPSSPGGSGRTAESHVVQVCDDCMANRAIAIARVGAIRNQVSSAFKEVLDKCADCVGGHRADALHAAEACESIDCSNLFQRDAQSRRYLAWSKAIRDLDN
ncbi:hypothetical protein BX070DRAFT_225753 [Coemansia spiralis]|nr:hypothetical protein BX070DRAFT_225753 [Coemansia spiralis]